MPHPRLFCQKVLSKSLVLESKTENKMMARLTKWEVELELRDLLAVKILSVKSCTMYLLSLIPGL